MNRTRNFRFICKRSHIYNPNSSTIIAYFFVLTVNVKEEPGSITISGEYLPSPRESHLLKEVKCGNFCPKCTLGLEIKHTDVLILSQYLRSDGCILPRRITGLCKIQQKHIGKLVEMAQKAGKSHDLRIRYTPTTPISEHF